MTPILSTKNTLSLHKGYPISLYIGHPISKKCVWFCRAKVRHEVDKKLSRKQKAVLAAAGLGILKKKKDKDK